jgi:hypothetical protein
LSTPPDDDEALKVDADCAKAMPRPPAFVPVQAPATVLQAATAP